MVKNLGVLLSVVGSVAGGLLCFTLPPLLWHKLCALEGRPVGRVGTAFLFLQIACGLALIVAGLVVVAESAHQGTWNAGAEGRGHTALQPHQQQPEQQMAPVGSGNSTDPTNPDAVYLTSTAAALAHVIDAATGTNLAARF